MSYKVSGFFLPKLKKMETEKVVIYGVAFDPIGIQTRLAPHNDHHHLNFVKNLYTVGGKITGEKI